MSSYKLTTKDIDTIYVALNVFLAQTQEYIKKDDEIQKGEHDYFHEMNLKKEKEIEELLHKIRKFKDDVRLYMFEEEMSQKYDKEIEDNVLSSIEVQTALDLYISQSKISDKDPEDDVIKVLKKALRTSQIKEDIEHSREFMKRISEEK